MSTHMQKELKDQIQELKKRCLIAERISDNNRRKIAKLKRRQVILRICGIHDASVYVELEELDIINEYHRIILRDIIAKVDEWIQLYCDGDEDNDYDKIADEVLQDLLNRYPYVEEDHLPTDTLTDENEVIEF